ncbi:MAG: cyclic nucleotide-binding domain-containing protein [Deltaproteobacteria bacterium]|nr:cyclic nucleotide-binding domain-containing protein [Deltaproteobacteria bacterium]
MTNSGAGAGSRPEIMVLERGQTVFSQDQKADRAYVLFDGTIGLWRKEWRMVELGPGEVLGLDGLFSRAGRYPCTARTETPCRLAAYAMSQLEDTVLGNPRVVAKFLSSLSGQLENCWQRLEFLQNDENEDPPFAGEIKEYTAGEVVIEENEKTTDIYRIVSTEQGLLVTKQGKHLAILAETGEIFGEMAAISNEPRSASIHSIGRSVLEVYTARQLQDVLLDYPKLSRRLIETLVKRLAETTRALTAKD